MSDNMKRMVNVGDYEKSVWNADLGDGTYQNPIIYADYSDPDIIRVGDDFFMVASSFNMSPCLPILHSKDLVNWKIVNHVCDTFPLDSYDKPRHGDGVWAPSIRYHDGKYWVFFGAPDEGIFMSTTEDPFGKWSPLHLVKEAKGWIDPCPFWDEDGQAYLVHAFARSRSGIKHILQICKMKPDGTALLDEGTYVYDGTENHPTMEGPKMYKRNGYYYIFAPAGGVPTGWQTILRSKSIYGPYEDKIVLHQGNTEVNGPHQGGYVELDSGESWFIHFQDKGAYGRITHLQPMSWDNDWPVMGHNVNKEGIGEPVLRWEKPNVPVQQEIMNPQTSDDFHTESLGLQWQWRANQKPFWYTLLNNNLRLHSISRPKDVETLYDLPNILTQKFPAPAFTTTTKMHFNPQSDEDYTGIIVFGLKYSGLMLKKSDMGLDVIHFFGDTESGSTQEVESVVGHIDAQTFYLRVDVQENAHCQFSFSEDGNDFHAIDKLFTAKEGQWVGAQIGIFCMNKGKQESSGFVDVEYFNIHQCK
ncbi:glycoside hydrolase 43 family protein [Evansella sp. AB-P1]|uniref:glycoside hydrolase family 43 protein n=1 Tax=Evansella sp. AB-P1 TaxID=3037653 RepID=UPI00241C5693|nr:glycoside hydrolase 43 family protein [Evansella sp. AB-P1]MDG5787857.1 glycoside hydrolase 43 family protein [Evansella sp. AB-P1]